MIYLLPHFVDHAADRAEDGEAFCAPGERLSYGELARRSNQLAHLLLDEGVRPGDRVGIFMPRCLETAVAVYGILKAGAAYVPIDPQMPPGGLAGLVDNCGIAHLVAHESLASQLLRLVERRSALQTIVGPGVAGPGAELGARVRLRPWGDLDELTDGSAPPISTTGDDLAYIMYSSGSTGRPKGIMHSHRSGMSYARLSVATYEVGPSDRIGNHSPLHFDMSTFGYFSGPCAGATTLLIPEAYTKMAASLSQLMESERLTIWYSVPLALIQLLGRGVLESRNLESLRWVLFGGEPFSRKHVEALMARWPQARFSNVYGPAEVNQCTYHHVPRRGEGAQDDGAPIPIGRTWDDTEALVVDEAGQPVADGKEGELLIRSSTMMLGYWARPDLDAEAFFRQCVDSNYERVFYRTGDLVRRQEQGELMFLGRKDRQVKIRGYRVELDEIERTITAHPAVEEAAVFPIRVGEEIDHLGAAVTSRPGATVEAEELRHFVSDLLSWYAVPKTTRVMDTLPRTTSGKIDRRGLQTSIESSGAPPVLS